MLGLPKTTEVHRQLPKKALYDNFHPKATDKKRFDNEIHRLTIVDEISNSTTNIAEGDTIKAFYVIHIVLRKAECDNKNLQMLSKFVPQKMIFILDFEGLAKLAVIRNNKVYKTEEKPLTGWNISLSGLNLDVAWENIILNIAGAEKTDGKTLDEQLAADSKKSKLRKKIEDLEKQARNELQPHRKWKLAEEVNRLKDELTNG